MAIDSALDDVKNQKAESVPTHLRDAHYKGAKKMGHGVGYQYPHNFPDAKVDQVYLPKDAFYYKPRPVGFERELLARLKNLRTKQP